MEAKITYQTASPGLADDQVAGDVIDRVRLLLKEEPETRMDYERLWLRYLVRFHGLSAYVAGAVLTCLDLSGAPDFQIVIACAQEAMRAMLRSSRRAR